MKMGDFRSDPTKGGGQKKLSGIGSLMLTTGATGSIFSAGPFTHHCGKRIELHGRTLARGLEFPG